MKCLNPIFSRIKSRTNKFYSTFSTYFFTQNQYLLGCSSSYELSVLQLLYGITIFLMYTRKENFFSLNDIQTTKRIPSFQTCIIHYQNPIRNSLHVRYNHEKTNKRLPRDYSQKRVQIYSRAACDIRVCLSRTSFTILKNSNIQVAQEIHGEISEKYRVDFFKQNLQFFFK